jgi:uncharacterized protein
MNITEFSDNLLKLYAEMSETFSSYQNSTGLTCLPGCGKCCENPDIEVSLYEMIPLALKLYEENRVDEFLVEDSGICLVYKDGRCSEYQYRPSVCRMFGAAGYFNKYREVELSTCPEIKREHSEKYLALQNDPDAPMFSNWSAKLSNLEPKALLERRPIREALKLALEKVCFLSQYNHV